MTRKNTLTLLLLASASIVAPATHAQIMPFDHGKRLYDVPRILEKQRQTDPDGPYESYLKIQYPHEAYRITKPAQCPIVISTQTPPDKKQVECRKYYSLSTQGRGSLLFLVNNTAISIALQSETPFDPALTHQATYRIISINIRPMQDYNTNRVPPAQPAEGRCVITQKHTVLCAARTGSLTLTVAAPGP